MKIKPYVRDSAFFQANRNAGLSSPACWLDLSFNNLSNFMNNKIVKIADRLAGNKVHGALDSDGTLLRNIGDLSTKFDRIRTSDIQNYSLTLDKFKHVSPSGVLHFIGGKWTQTSNILGESAIFVNRAAGHQFERFSVNLLGDLITTEKVDVRTINDTHLSLAAKNLAATNIKQSYILDNTITNSKFTDKAFGLPSISYDLMQEFITGPKVLIRSGVTGLASDVHMVKSNNIADNSFDFNGVFGNNPILRSVNLPFNAFSIIADGTIQTTSFFNALNLCSPSDILNDSFVPEQIKGIPKQKLSNAILTKLRIGGLAI